MATVGRPRAGLFDGVGKACPAFLLASVGSLQTTSGGSGLPIKMIGDAPPRPGHPHESPDRLPLPPAHRTRARQQPTQTAAASSQRGHGAGAIGSYLCCLRPGALRGRDEAIVVQADDESIRLGPCHHRAGWGVSIVAVLHSSP